MVSGEQTKSDCQPHQLVDLRFLFTRIHQYVYDPLEMNRGLELLLHRLASYKYISRRRACTLLIRLVNPPRLISQLRLLPALVSVGAILSGPIIRSSGRTSEVMMKQGLTGWR